MKIKAKDIAKALELSPATVSLALNNKPGVKEKTRKLILDYVEELGEKEERKKGESHGRIVKMVLYQKENRFFQEEDKKLFSASYDEIYRILSRSGYSLQLVYVHHIQEAAAVVENCQADRTAGIIVNGDNLTEDEMRPFAECEQPVLLFDHWFENLSFDQILIHNQQGVYDGLRYLQERGHEEVLYLANSYDIFNFIERREAFAKYAEALFPGDNKSCMVQLGNTIEEIYRSMSAYLQEHSLPAALFCENYAVTIGVVRALQHSGCQIGTDISVIGIDEIPQSALLGVDMTYLRVPHGRKAVIGMKRLLERMQERDQERIQIRVNPELVEGSSVRETV